MQNFVVQFNLAGDLAGNPLPSLNPLEAETLPMAVRAVQKTLDCTEIESATIFVPVRVLRASRRVEITDANGNTVAVDTPAGDLDGRIRPLSSSSPYPPLVDPDKDTLVQARAEALSITTER